MGACTLDVWMSKTTANIECLPKTVVNIEASQIGNCYECLYFGCMDVDGWTDGWTPKTSKLDPVKTLVENLSIYIVLGRFLFVRVGEYTEMADHRKN